MRFKKGSDGEGLMSKIDPKVENEIELYGLLIALWDEKLLIFVFVFFSVNSFVAPSTGFGAVSAFMIENFQIPMLRASSLDGSQIALRSTTA